jgi:hypothetical protein
MTDRAYLDSPLREHDGGVWWEKDNRKTFGDINSGALRCFKFSRFDFERCLAEAAFGSGRLALVPLYSEATRLKTSPRTSPIFKQHTPTRINQKYHLQLPATLYGDQLRAWQGVEARSAAATAISSHLKHCPSNANELQFHVHRGRTGTDEHMTGSAVVGRLSRLDESRLGRWTD